MFQYKMVHIRPEKIPVPFRRFAHVHVDLVGPLPSSHGFTYLFTCIDRSTEHRHRPSCLGEHFFESRLTSFSTLDLDRTTSLGVTSPEKLTSAKIPNSIRSGIKLDLKTGLCRFLRISTAE